MIWLDPKNDLTFKKVFGEHPHLLISFLNALLPLQEDELIVSLQYLPAEMVPSVPLMKNTIVDVRCTDEKGRQFIVEMQMNWTTGFMQRVLFNAAKAYVKQLDKGDEYALLQPVYALNLIDDTFDSTNSYYHHYQIVETESPASKLEGLEFVFVELPKFTAMNIQDKKLQVLWLRYLTEVNEKSESIHKDLLESPEICEAVEYLQESAFTREQLLYYDKYWDTVRVERTLIEEASAKASQIGFEKGEQIGFEKGEQIGFEKGEQIGLEKGEQIGYEKGQFINSCKTAIKALKKEMHTADISELTNLPVETVEKLKNILQKYGDDAELHLDGL